MDDIDAPVPSEKPIISTTEVLDEGTETAEIPSSEATTGNFRESTDNTEIPQSPPDPGDDMEMSEDESVPLVNNTADSDSESKPDSKPESSTLSKDNDLSATDKHSTADDTEDKAEDETPKLPSHSPVPASKKASDRVDESDSGSDAEANRKDSSSDSGDSDRSAKSGGGEEKVTPTKRRILSDSEDSDDENTASQPKKKRLHSDDSDSDVERPTSSKRIEDDNEEGEKKEEGEGLIADIFGDSSDEGGEFEGFDESEIQKTEESKTALPDVSSEDELDDDERGGKTQFVSDFEMMMAKKKEERNSSRRRKRNVDIINDNDDLIVDLLRKMKEAADEDRTLNQNQQPAMKKLIMLPQVLQQLNKAELQTAFMECGVLSALTEWLAPLPDRSLPHLKIRESLLRVLVSLPHPHTDQLKSSGIGKAVMYLFKHPKELRANRDIASRLINDWSRPIFGQSSNYKSVSREDREKRDLDSIPKNRRRSSEAGADAQERVGPGDPGWIARARVPRPSNKDYVVRPSSSVDPEAFHSRSSSKKTITRYEKQKRKMDTKRKAMKGQQAVKISIEGKNMAL